MNLRRTLINGKKRAFHLSGLGLCVSLFANSVFGYFASPVAAQARNSGDRPTVATVKSIVNGDLMCYVTLVDDNGVRHESVGATFEICANESAFLNKRVNLVYEQASVNDCQSAEPCGRSRLETLIVEMTPTTK
jgi:hypothetical protein